MLTSIDLFHKQAWMAAGARDAIAPRIPRVIRCLAARPHDWAPTVLTIGKFDGVHRGHQAILARAREAASRYGVTLTVMTFHPHPRDFFAGSAMHRDARRPTCGPRVASLRDTLAALGDAGVDHVVFQRFDARFAALPAQQFVDDVLVAQLRVRALFVGDDFRFGAGRSGDVSMLAREGDRCGFAVETVAPVSSDGIGARISSSAIREALATPDLARAAGMLGRAYSISGRLVRCDAGWRLRGGTCSPLPDGRYPVLVHGPGTRPVRAQLQVRRGADACGATPMFVVLPPGFDAVSVDRHQRGYAVRITFLEIGESGVTGRSSPQRMFVDMHVT